MEYSQDKNNVNYLLRQFNILVSANKNKLL